MPTLNNYTNRVRRFLGDQNMTLFNEGDLSTYVNDARRQIAMETGCVRFLATVPTVQAQEVYTFSSFDTSSDPGIADVQGIRGVSLIWGTYRYTLRAVSFSRYQAQVRNYTTDYQYIPAFVCQYGQGQNGSIYIYPLPNDVYSMEIDCICTPIILSDDSDVDLIPFPFADAVAFYAAWQALNGMQMQGGEEAQRRVALADRAFGLYEKFIKRARAFSQPGQVANWYGRR